MALARICAILKVPELHVIRVQIMTSFVFSEHSLKAISDYRFIPTITVLMTTLSPQGKETCLGMFSGRRLPLHSPALMSGP